MEVERKRVKKKNGGMRMMIIMMMMGMGRRSSSSNEKKIQRTKAGGTPMRQLSASFSRLRFLGLAS